MTKKYEHSEETKRKISNSKKGSIPWNKGLKGIQKCSEETKLKISNSTKGKPKSEETKRKMSENHADFSGENNPFYDKHFSEETIREMSENKKGINNSMYGKHHSEETKKKLSESMSGKNHPNFGKHLPEETKLKQREKKLGISLTKEHKQKISDATIGENNPRWLGGIAYLPYCYKFNNKLKEEIRERDGRICQNCGKTEEENGRKLDVHHIHYDKDNCYPDLISLCRICNTIANSNRTYWEEHFMEKLRKRNLLNYFGDNYGNG